MRLHRRSANYREIYPRVWTRGSLVLGNGGLLGGYIFSFNDSSDSILSSWVCVDDFIELITSSIGFQKRIPFCSPIYSRCCRWIICYHFMLLFKIKCNPKSLCDVDLINRVKPIIIAIIRIFLYTFKFRFILFKTCIF